MTNYASVRRVALQARVDSLDAGKDGRGHQYHQSRGQHINKLVSANNGRAVSDAVEDDIDDWLLTTIETGVPMPEMGPAEYQRILDADGVKSELNRLRYRQQAQEAFRAETDDAAPLTKPVPLSVFLEQEDEDAAYRVDRLLPSGGRALLTAPYKSGKSVFIGNLLRSLADGAPFLGEYAVKPAEQGITLIDDELDERTLRRWLRAQGIINTDLIEVVSLRGKTGSFNITDPQIRAEWVRTIEGSDVLILDCLRPVLDSIGLDENKDAGRFLVAFDALLSEALIEEGVIVHHAGHQGERARGDSRLQDWPDALWKIVRAEKDEPSSERYFSAFGRDVDEPETLLKFDPETKHLSLGEGNRQEAGAEDALEAIEELLDVTENRPGLSGRQIQLALKNKEGITQRQVTAGIALGRKKKIIHQYGGPRGAVLHMLINPSSASVHRSASPVHRDSQFECISASIDDALTQHTDKEPVNQENNGKDNPGPEQVHQPIPCPLHPSPEPDACYTCNQIKESTS